MFSAVLFLRCISVLKYNIVFFSEDPCLYLFVVYSLIVLFRPHLSLSLGSFPLSFVFIYYHLVFVFSLDIFDTEFWTSPTCDTREVALLTENMKFTALASRASRTYMLYKGFQQMEIICYYRSRSGGATLAANSGVPERNLQHHGRWASTSAKNIYVRDSIASRLEVSKSLSL